MLGGNVLDRILHFLLKLRCRLLPTEFQLRVVHQLRRADLLCDQRPERGDGMPRGQPLHGWVECCGHLPSWHVLWVCSERMLKLRSGHLSVKYRLSIVRELRSWVSVFLNRPRLRCRLPRWELLLGRYR